MLIVLGQADNYFQSWSWWQFKSYNDITTQSIGDAESFYDSKGKLQTEKVIDSIKIEMDD